MVTTADKTNRNGAVMLEYYCSMTDNLSLLKKVLTDGGYIVEKSAGSVKSISGSEAEVVKCSKLHKFTVIPKR